MSLSDHGSGQASEVICALAMLEHAQRCIVTSVELLDDGLHWVTHGHV